MWLPSFQNHGLDSNGLVAFSQSCFTKSWLRATRHGWWHLLPNPTRLPLQNQLPAASWLHGPWFCRLSRLMVKISQKLK